MTSNVRFTDEERKAIRSLLVRACGNNSAIDFDAEIERLISQLEQLRHPKEEFSVLLQKPTANCLQQQLSDFRNIRIGHKAVADLPAPLQRPYLDAIKAEHVRKGWPTDEESVLTTANSRLAVYGERWSMRQLRIRIIDLQRYLSGTKKKGGRPKDERKHLACLYLVIGLERLGLHPVRPAKYSTNHFAYQILELTFRLHGLDIEGAECLLFRVFEEHKEKRAEIAMRIKPSLFLDA